MSIKYYILPLIKQNEVLSIYIYFIINILVFSNNFIMKTEVQYSYLSIGS